MIFAHLNYKEYESGELHYDVFQILYAREVKFCRALKWHTIPKGISVNELQSNHPFWRRYALKERRKYLYFIQSQYNKCKKDESQIKYLFNINESLYSIRKKVLDLTERTYK